MYQMFCCATQISQTVAVDATTMEIFSVVFTAKENSVFLSISKLQNVPVSQQLLLILLS